MNKVYKDKDGGLFMLVNNINEPEPCMSLGFNHKIKNRMLIEDITPEHIRLFMDISKEARLEKAGRPPISKLLYWWGRKPLIVSRVTTLLATTPIDGMDTSEALDTIRHKLGLNNEKRAFNYKPRIDTNLTLNPSKVKVLDPFGGGGNLLFESVRLGFNCSAIDCNPVAYLILKATLEYPAKYGDRLADDVRRYGLEVIKRAKAELGRFYRKDAVTYIWCWCIICPYCGQRIPLTNQTWLDKRRKIGYKIKPNNKDFTIELTRLESDNGYTQKGGKVTCINCHNIITHKVMTGDVAKRRDKELIITVIKDYLNGVSFELPTDEDKEYFNLAKEELQKRWEWLLANDLIPLEEIKHSELQRTANYGLKHWYEFFNERQLLLFTTLVRIIREVINELSTKIEDKEYVKAIATYLGIMVCKQVDYCCIGTRWDVGQKKIAHALTFRTPRLVHGFAEVNPFIKTAGSLYSMLKTIVDAIKFSSSNLGNNIIANTDTDSAISKNTGININANVATIRLGSVCNLNDYPSDKFDLVITDPPYYDDIPYGEASEFFYVWLVRILKNVYPELPPNVPTNEDLIYSKERFGGNAELATEFYKKGMTTAFQNIHKVLKDNGLFIVFFANSNVKAWVLLLEILRESGFRVVSSFTLRTESEENVMMRDKVAFMSSIVLVCRKNDGSMIHDNNSTNNSGYNNNITYFEDLIPEIEKELRTLVKLLAEYITDIPITDLITMAYGKVLEVTTKYPIIVSRTNNTKIDFKLLFTEAREYIFKEVVRSFFEQHKQSPSFPLTTFVFLTKIFNRGILLHDDIRDVFKLFSPTISVLTKKGYITMDDDGIKVRPYTELPTPTTLDDLYQQYIYILKLVDTKKDIIDKVDTSANTTVIPNLLRVIDIMVKHYGLLRYKRVKLRPDEVKEYELLKIATSVVKSISANSQKYRNNTLDIYTAHV